jgi:alkylated DNA repair dioxygenase AlkB
MTTFMPRLFPSVGLPEGFRYQDDVLSPEQERTLIEAFAPLPFREFEFRGFLGKRRTVSYGWLYDFNVRELREAEAIPAFLLDLRQKAANFAGLPEGRLQHALVTEYSPGAAIGWHRDRDEFDDVIGISLLAPCMFRFRRKAERGWQRASKELLPRSAYLLRGGARADWQHSIPPVPTLRYSVTFRSLREEWSIKRNDRTMKLSELIAQRRKTIAAFEEDVYGHGEYDISALNSQIEQTPVISKDDALAALDLVIAETIQPKQQLALSMLAALRRYVDETCD